MHDIAIIISQYLNASTNYLTLMREKMSDLMNLIIYNYDDAVS